jgi:hypothetical protein
MAEVIATAFQSLTTLPRPDSPQNLTIWFMHELHLEGFPGRTGFFLDDFTMVLALNAEARPSREEMDVSDGMLFSLIPEDQDDEEEGEEYDEEAEYDMWRGLSQGKVHGIETFFDQVAATLPTLTFFMDGDSVEEEADRGIRLQE